MAGLTFSFMIPPAILHTVVYLVQSEQFNLSNPFAAIIVTISELENASHPIITSITSRHIGNVIVEMRGAPVSAGLVFCRKSKDRQPAAVIASKQRHARRLIKNEAVICSQ